MLYRLIHRFTLRLNFQNDSPRSVYTYRENFEKHRDQGLRMNRGLLTILGSVLSISSYGAGGSEQELLPVSNNVKSADKPNVILFLVDDWGVMDTSVPLSYDIYADNEKPVARGFNEFYKTPNLEDLAKDGMSFTQAYALPVCSPTRASLMTGFNAPRHGITVHLNLDGGIDSRTFNTPTHRNPDNWRYRGMDSTDLTLPQLLSEQGYRTIHVGKGHFASAGEPASDPAALGFEISLGGSHNGSPARYIGTPGWGSEIRPVPDIETYEENGKFLTVALTEAHNDALEQAVVENIPFFSYMSYYAVHTPHTQNPNATGDYRNATNISHEQFASMVEGVDTSLGMIRDKLEELGVAENTLLLFMGDNGSNSPALSDHGLIDDPDFSDYPIRGKKATHWEGGIHVPLFISWAKNDPSNTLQQMYPIVSGGIEHDIVSLVDIAPTILSIANVAHPSMDGVDLTEYLNGSPGTHREQTLLIHQPNDHRTGYFTTYRRNNFKLTYFYATDSFQLYDLSMDRRESNDIANTEPALVGEMASEMINALNDGWGEYGEIWPALNPEQIEVPARPLEEDPPHFTGNAVLMCNGLAVTIDMNNGDSPSSPNSDVILGTAENDNIDAGDGDDVICGGRGNDTIEGGKGKDIIFGQGGDDTLVGGCQSLCSSSDTSADELTGGVGNDTLLSNANSDATAYGGPGIDNMSGSGMLFGGADDDIINPGPDSKAFGQKGNDNFHLFDFSGVAYGGDGDDYFEALSPVNNVNNSSVTLYGDRGDDDFFVSGADGYVMYGGNGKDDFQLNGDSHIVHAGRGNDTVDIVDGDVQHPNSANLSLLVVFGNEDDDTMNCSDTYSCMFYGGNGSDTLNGASQNDILNGNSGNDFIYGFGGADDIRGHDGNDMLDGGAGADTIRGGADDDTVVGGGHGDTVHGNSGTDICDDTSHASCETPYASP